MKHIKSDIHIYRVLVCKQFDFEVYPQILFKLFWCVVTSYKYMPNIYVEVFRGFIYPGRAMWYDEKHSILENKFIQAFNPHFNP